VEQKNSSKNYKGDSTGLDYDFNKTAHNGVFHSGLIKKMDARQEFRLFSHC
jgi:hypothetical protein